LLWSALIPLPPSPVGEGEQKSLSRGRGI
jgi:hypothetical protein